MFDAGQGKLNSWQNHSRSPVILHKTPLLILLPLNSSTGFPNWSFFGITPEKRISHDQATVSITCLKLFLVMASFGIAVISSWLSFTLLLESKHLQALAKPILKQNHWIEHTLWGGCCFFYSIWKPWPEAQDLYGVDFCEGGCISMQKPWDR